MRVKDLEPSVKGVAKGYADLLDVLVIGTEDQQSQADIKRTRCRAGFGKYPDEQPGRQTSPGTRGLGLACKIVLRKFSGDS